MRFAVLAAGISALWAQPAMADLLISISGSGYGRGTYFDLGLFETTFEASIQFDPAGARRLDDGLLFFTHEDRDRHYWWLGLTSLTVIVHDDLLMAWGTENYVANSLQETFNFSLQFAPGYLSSGFPTSSDPDMFVGGTFQGGWHIEYPKFDYFSFTHATIDNVEIQVVPRNVIDPVQASVSVSWDWVPYNPQVPAVPEPATWAMMLSGFAVLGAGLRRRKPTVRYSFS